MRKRQIPLIFSIVVLISALIVLFLNPDVLTDAISETPYFPVGTLLFWLVFMAWPAAFFFGIKAFREKTRGIEKIIKTVLKIMIVLGALWGLISFGLANNWAFNFKSQEEFRGGVLAGRLFHSFNVLLLFSTPVVVLIFLLNRLFLKLKERL